MARSKSTTSQPSDAGAAVRLEPRAATILQWDPGKLVQARLRCTYGDFSLFSDLCEAMMPDDRVSSCLEKLYAATTLPLTFLLPGKDSKQSANDPCVQALDRDWWLALPEQKLKTVVAWIGLANACLLHVDRWDLDPESGRRIPVVTVWSLRHLRSDAQKGLVVRAATSATDSWGVEETIEPGDGNWILLLAGDSWKCIGQARGHQVALFWLLKQYAIVDWALSSERHGGGITVVSCDKDCKSIKKDRDEIALAMSQMSRCGSISLPPGWIFELVTDTANTFATFAAQIKAANDGNTIGILGTNLTTEVTGGSRAAASVHESVDAGRMRGLLELLATGFRQQLLVYWAAFNSSAWVAPYAKWDTTPPVDKKSQAEARSLDATALLTYRKAGAQLNQKAWFEGRVEILATASDDFPSPPAADTSPAAPKDSVPAAPAKTSLRGSQARAAAKDPTDLAFERGLDYTGRVEESLRGHAAKLLAPDVASVLAAIDKAGSYQEAKDLLAQAYQDRATPSQLCRLTDAALLMCQLAGAESVEQELQED
jgi:hypothetical protein